MARNVAIAAPKPHIPWREVLLSGEQPEWPNP